MTTQNVQAPKDTRPRLQLEVSKINHTLSHLIHQLRHKGQLASPCSHTKKTTQHKGVGLEYAKVTQTATVVDGVEYHTINRHYTDASEMKRALQWDDNSKIGQPRSEYTHKTIKLKTQSTNVHTVTDSMPDRLKGVIPLKENGQTYPNGQGVGKSGQQVSPRSPKFHNQLIQKRTSMVLIPSNPHVSESSSQGRPQQTRVLSNTNTFYKQQHANKHRRPQNKNNGQFNYRKKKVTNYYQREHSFSPTSTDSEFSQFQL